GCSHGFLPYVSLDSLLTMRGPTIHDVSWECKLSPPDESSRRGATVGPMDLEDQPTKRVCSVADALSTVGDRYSLLIVREIGYGYVRFKDLVAYTGAPRDVLTSRLRRLEEVGVLERRMYSEHPPRYEYHLTQAGADLRPIVLALKEWGDQHVNPG